MILRLITEVLAAYIATAVIVNGHIFYRFREWVKERTPWLYKGMPPRHLVDCRMCTGFWVSLVISVLCQDWVFTPIVYGASYFMATQER